MSDDIHWNAQPAGTTPVYRRPIPRAKKLGFIAPIASIVVLGLLAVGVAVYLLGRTPVSAQANAELPALGLKLDGPVFPSLEKIRQRNAASVKTRREGSKGFTFCSGGICE